MRTHGLSLHAPDRLAYGGRSVRVGPRVWELLSMLIERGEVRQDECARKAISARTLVYRANEKLAEVGAGVRCGTDAGAINLC